MPSLRFSRRFLEGVRRGRCSETSMIPIALGDSAPSEEGPLVSLPAHLAGIPAIIAHKLEAFVGNVLGDSGYEIAEGEDLAVVAADASKTMFEIAAVEELAHYVRDNRAQIINVVF